MTFAAPVSNGKFSLAVDSFYVETSNHNLHRRATVPELQSLFDTRPRGTLVRSAVVALWTRAVEE